MTSRLERAIVVLALAALGGGLAAPSPASAQNTSQSLQDSCTSFSQTLVSQVYSASPWLAGAVEQLASPEFRQRVQERALQALMAPDSNELGSLVREQMPTVTVTPNDSSQGGLTSCTYQVTGNFQRGTALLHITLVNRDGQWQVMDFGMHDVQRANPS
jgi:hypothetical protein